MKLACVSPVVPGASLTQKAQLLRDCGYDGISVFLEWETWGKTLEHELLTLEKRTGVVPCEVVFSGPLYGHLMDRDEEISASAMKMYREAARLCGQLGAVTELEYSYGLVSELPMFHPYQRMSEKDWDRFLNVYRNVLEPVAGTDGRVLLEPINRYEAPYLNCVDHCVEVMEALGADNGGLLLDFFHLSIEEADIAASVQKAGPYIRHVHMADSNRLPPGYGHTDWHSALSAMRQAGYRGFCVLECAFHGEIRDLLRRTRRYLNQLERQIEEELGN